MAFYISDRCTECGACEWKCPARAILTIGPKYRHAIDPNRCTECVGDACEPRCVAVCPAEAIMRDPARGESATALLAKFQRLHPYRQPVLF